MFAQFYHNGAFHVKNRGAEPSPRLWKCRFFFMALLSIWHHIKQRLYSLVRVTKSEQIKEETDTIVTFSRQLFSVFDKIAARVQSMSLPLI